ncbi:hypothetical protein Goari_025237 [Gossypium aridum]|uniref:Uncharacterized protein n=1 Tax=Gossypium aridum TaxID=34290 RepID=A0A7J8X8R9_GOSAI|nr:hypothetical protein [Gossypium aridum]
MEKMQGALNFSRNKLMERNNALKPMVMALKEETMATMKVLNTRIEELEGELTLYRTVMDRRVSSATLNSKSRSTNKRHREIGTWEEFQHELKSQFYSEYVEEETWESCDGLRNETGIRTRKCPKAIKSHDSSRVYGQARSKKDKLESKKDKLESSKFEENGICEANYEEKIVMEMTIVVPKLSEEVSHQKGQWLDKAPRRLGSSEMGVEARRAKNNKKKPVKCFLCYGPNKL